MPQRVYVPPNYRCISCSNYEDASMHLGLLLPRRLSCGCHLSGRLLLSLGVKHSDSLRRRIRMHYNRLVYSWLPMCGWKLLQLDHR